MNTNSILSADLLDLVFDDRNKEYGAYELRKTYHTRIKKALLITTGIAAVIFTGTALAGTLKPAREAGQIITQVQLINIPDEKQPEPLPPPRSEPPPPVRTIHAATVDIVPDEDVVEPPPTVDDARNARIDVFTSVGADDVGLVEPTDITGKGIIEESVNKKTNEPYTEVQVQARFIGNWEKFLMKNLRGNVSVDNGAPVGRYRVVIQFVVDIDGSISDLRPLTNIGYGMEEEAMRVIRKSDKWEPAIQNGYKVKAYRQQPVIFEVGEE